MRQILLILLMVSGSLSIFQEGLPCNFSHECDCSDVLDAICKCKFGKCALDFGFGFNPNRECSTYKDCSCRDTPLNCRCNLLQACIQERVECQVDSDCTQMAKCAGRKCSCQGNTCEPGKMCKPSDQWKTDCDFCPNGGSVKVDCNTCGCRNGEPFGCTKLFCREPPLGNRKICKPNDQWGTDCDYCPSGGSVKVDCNTCGCNNGEPSFCTKIGCRRPNPGPDNKKICKPSDHWKRDCNFCPDGGSVWRYCNNCKCRNGEPLDCTKKFCGLRQCISVCTKEWAPICGVNGKTYKNPCIANCSMLSGESGATMKCLGKCPCSVGEGSCHCPKSWEPVCGSDGRTHGNECRAKCKGASVECQGMCPCPEKPHGL